MSNTCKGICKKYKANKPFGRSRYDVGQKKCQICGIFVKWDGLYCPCCCCKLRTKPRNTEKKGLKCSICGIGVSFWSKISKWMKYRGKDTCVKCWLAKIKPKCCDCGKIPKNGKYRIPHDMPPMCAYCYRRKARLLKAERQKQRYSITPLTIHSISSN